MGKEWQWSRGSRKDEKEVVPGCMSGMMHFFDFHQLLFTTSTCTRPPQEEAAAGSSPQNQQNYSAAQLKGLEAPRNSLELDEDAAANASASAATADDYFGIPYGLQLAPAPSPVKQKKKKKEEELHFLQAEEERRSSQAVTPRTPNLVARLMGLEILPDEFFTPTAGSVSVSLQHSPKITPKSSSKKVKKKNNSDHESRGESTPPPPTRQPLQRRDCNIPSHATPAGSRSLPETPRASSERYRDADPRLSLQLNKENSSRSAKEYNYPAEAPGERSVPPSPSPLHTTTARRKDCLKVHDENKSPRGRHYAREIVKQVKESISRRGSSVSGSSSDEHLLESRRTRTSADQKNAFGNNIDTKNSAAKPSPSLSPPPPPLLCRPSSLSCSPEFDIPRPQHIPTPSPSANPSPSSSTSSFSYSAAAAAARDYPEAKGSKMGSTKCQRASYERFTERIKRHSTPPPADVLASPALSSPSNMAAVRRRKFEASQENRRRLPPEPLVHPSSSTLANLEEKLLNGSVKPLALSNQTSKDQNPEFHYVRSILERAGIMGTSQQAYTWFSPSLPIHPFVFHQLELDLPFFPRGPVRHRCNRKLLFHLVDEILGELVGWSAARSLSVDRELLLERLWSRIRSFPSANCQVIGDIDVLVAGDLTETRVKRLLQHPSVVAEAEDIVLEIEQDVLDSILGEAAASFAGN